MRKRNQFNAVASVRNFTHGRLVNRESAKVPCCCDLHTSAQRYCCCVIRFYQRLIYSPALTHEVDRVTCGDETCQHERYLIRSVQRGVKKSCRRLVLRKRVHSLPAVLVRQCLQPQQDLPLVGNRPAPCASFNPLISTLPSGKYHSFRDQQLCHSLCTPAEEKEMATPTYHLAFRTTVTPGQNSKPFVFGGGAKH